MSTREAAHPALTFVEGQLTIIRMAAHAGAVASNTDAPDQAKLEDAKVTTAQNAILEAFAFRLGLVEGLRAKVKEQEQLLGKGTELIDAATPLLEDTLARVTALIAVLEPLRPAIERLAGAREAGQMVLVPAQWRALLEAMPPPKEPARG